MRIALFLTVFTAALFLPETTHAAIVTCSGPDCNWASFISLAQNVLNFIVSLAVVAAAVMFAYAGWLFFSSGANTSNLEQGKKIFTSVVVGLIIILVAWLVVNTLLDVLTGRGLEQRTNDINNSATVDITRAIV